MKCNSLLACVLAVFIGCAPVVLDTKQAAKRVEELINEPELDEYSSVRGLVEQLYSKIPLMAFAGLLTAEDIDSLTILDGVEYTLSLAYKALIEGDKNAYRRYMQDAVSVVDEVSNKLKTFEKRSIDKFGF